MSIRRNAVANFLGQGWNVLMALAFIPIYIDRLGIEAYGLIGVFTVLQAWMTLLDVGIGPALNREMARYVAGAQSVVAIRTLLRTLEVASAAIALLIFAVLWAGSAAIAEHWLQLRALGAGEVADAITLMGAVVALRFLEGLYRAAVLGLQRHVWLNAFGAIVSTARWGGAALVVSFGAPSIGAFFLWQAAVSLAAVLVSALVVRAAIPKADRMPRFAVSAIAGIGRFAGGVTASTALNLVLTQSDKILLSRFLTLDDFGRYAFATTIAGTLMHLVVPITQTYYPRFSELVARDARPDLVDSYRHGGQLTAVMVIPAALMLVLFPDAILALWTGSAAVDDRVGSLVRVLAAGCMLNAMMHIPYVLQLAHGWLAFTVRLNAISVCVFVPALYWVAPRFGAMGAAWLWLSLNLAYVFVSLPLVHGKLLATEKWHWYRYNLALPLLASLAVGVLAGGLRPNEGGSILLAVWLSCSGLLMFLAALLCAPIVRDKAWEFVRGFARGGRAS